MSSQESNRVIAENNNNYSLYRLKKDDLKNICDYYDIFHKYQEYLKTQMYKYNRRNIYYPIKESNF